MNTLYLTNGRIVTPQGKIDSLLFDDGCIAGFSGAADCEYDLEGDFLVPLSNCIPTTWKNTSFRVPV